MWAIGKRGSSGRSLRDWSRRQALAYGRDLDRFARMPLIEGLISLSVRWMQPIQQQGRRFPFTKSSIVRFKCFCFVSGCLTDRFQQIHSLRASAVRLSHAARAVSLAASACPNSSGSSWTVPPEIPSLIWLDTTQVQQARIFIARLQRAGSVGGGCYQG